MSIPAAFGLSFLALPVWNVFYGINEYGPSVFQMSIITAIFSNLYLVSIQTAQSLNKYKTVYVAVIVGFLANALLDVPLMLLFNKLHLPAYYGASFATIIGFSIAVGIVLLSIKKIEGINYSDTWKILLKLLISLAIMLGVLYLLKLVLPFHTTSKLLSIIDIIIYAVIGAVIYLLLTYKMGIIEKLFGRKIIDKVFKIITFGKYKRKEHNDDNKED